VLGLPQNCDPADEAYIQIHVAKVFNFRSSWLFLCWFIKMLERKRHHRVWISELTKVYKPHYRLTTIAVAAILSDTQRVKFPLCHLGE